MLFARTVGPGMLFALIRMGDLVLLPEFIEVAVGGKGWGRVFVLEVGMVEES